MTKIEADAARLGMARRALWEGTRWEDAAKLAGMSARTLRRRFRERGWKVDQRRKLGDADLARAMAWLEAGETITDIAKRLSVHRVTMSRAIAALRKEAKGE